MEHLARVALLAMLVRAGPAAPGGRPHGAVAKTEVGVASYYDSRFDSSLTASGVRYNENALTAAHHTLPFGTRVRVTNLANHRSVVVTINVPVAGTGAGCGETSTHARISRSHSSMRRRQSSTVGIGNPDHFIVNL